MKRRVSNGLFVTIEGGEGTGKSTLIESLYHYLTEEKKRVVVRSFEPGGTSFGREVRKILLDQKDALIAPRAELLLFLADRAHHVETLIRPSLDQDMVVLCDRFTDSSLAYQGAARQTEEPKELEKACLFATGGLEPDLTFYLDLDPEEGLRRIEGDKDRLESETIDFHRRVREGYLELAKKNKKRIHIIDASKSPEEVFQVALKTLSKILQKSYASF